MKNLRQKLTPGLALLGLIASALIVSVQASDFPELGGVTRNGGFRMEGYWVWCGSVIKGDDGRVDVVVNRTRMTRIQRIDADPFQFYPR